VVAAVPYPAAKTPAEPEINWYTLPASVNVVLDTYLLSSVNDIVVLPYLSFRVKEPGNNFSVYWDRSTEIA
jgi:hypothetical protein